MIRPAKVLLVLLGLPTLAFGAQEEIPTLQTALDSALADLGASGGAAAVVFGDDRVWTGAGGIAAPSEPATPSTAFELGSVTKTYTAAVVLGLAAEGRLSLDDTLDRWHPEIAGSQAITVEMLLNHTHGLHDPVQEPDFVPSILQDPARTWTPEDLLERLGDPYFEPGTSWRYSNTGFHLLGRIAERVADRPMAALVRELLLEPLGLGETWYGATEPVVGPAAAAFIDVNGDGSPVPVSTLIPWTAFLTSAGAAGSMIATAPDAAKWLHALAGGRVLSEAGWTRMTTWVDRPDGHRYGLGLLRLERPEGALIGHRGNSAGFSAAVFHDPSAGVTVAMLTNAHATDVTPAVLALLEAARSYLALTRP